MLVLDARMLERPWPGYATYGYLEMEGGETWRSSQVYIA